MSAPNVLRDGYTTGPGTVAGRVVFFFFFFSARRTTDPDQAATSARIVALEPPSDHGALTGLNDDDHALYALADGTRGAFAAPLGADDNYVTDAEKAALHAHSNKAALDLVSGTNTGDQVLPTWSTISASLPWSRRARRRQTHAPRSVLARPVLRRLRGPVRQADHHDPDCARRRPTRRQAATRSRSRPRRSAT